MSPYKTLEYLFYLVVFILLYQLADAEADVKHFNATTASIQEKSSHSQTRATRPTLKDCEVDGLSWMCMKIEFVKILEQLNEQKEFNIVSGISVVKDMNATTIKNSEMMAEIARSYPQDPNARLNGLILAKLQNFIKSRYLRFRLIDNETVSEARSALVSSRKYKQGKKGGMEAIVAVGLMMKGTLMAMGMGAIALIAGKALLAALVALTLAAAAGVKGMAGGGGKSTTYEIIQKPIYTSSHSHSVSHEDGHAAYNGHYGSGHGASGYGGYARALHPHILNQMKSQ